MPRGQASDRHPNCWSSRWAVCSDWTEPTQCFSTDIQGQEKMRSRLSRLIAAAAFAWASTTALAQGVATLQDMRKVTDAAMELVGKGDLDAGLKSFRTLAIVPKAEFDTLLAQAAMHAPTMTSRFGNSRGYEFIEEKWVGKSLVRLTYLHKYDLHGTRWVFYCYLGKDGWVINTFRFDDKLHELF